MADSNPSAHSQPTGGRLGRIIDRIKARLQAKPRPTQQEAIEQIARGAAHDIGASSEGSFSHTLADGTKVYDNFATQDGSPVTTHFGPNGEIAIFIGDKPVYRSVP